MRNLKAGLIAGALALSPLTIGLPAALGQMAPTTHVVAGGGLYDPLPRCAEEDGSDVDGFCVWVDPDTGDMYVNPTPEEVTRNDDAIYERGYVN
jgi:hypothetical protein